MARDTGGGAGLCVGARALQLLAMLLLILASELAALSCGHRIPRADVASWKREPTPAPTERSASTTTALAAASGAVDAAAAAALDESKRLVPHGPNPLHN